VTVFKLVKQVAEVIGWPLCGGTGVTGADASIDSSIYFKRHYEGTTLTEILLDQTRLHYFNTNTGGEVRHACV